MDSAGKNRYELLFMDDDISDPLDNIVAKKKKQVKTAAAGGAATTAAGATGAAANGPKTTNKPANNQVKKTSNQAEKENKPLNKNDNKKPAAAGATDRFNKQGGAGGAGGAAGGANRKRNNGETREGGQGQQQQRNVNFRQQNGETREQRNNRRNVRENGQAGAAGGERPPFRGGDRADRPPRNRNFEGGNRKREFDRQSGSDKTGVKAVDKRDGAGAHNWGSVKDTIEEGNTTKTVEENGNAANAGEKNEESGNEQATEQTPVEEEVKELTLDEWKAQQQQRAKPQFNIRKAGEGEDTTKWKKMIVLNNSKATKEKKGTESEEELEFDPAMYPQRVGRQQRVLDIQFNFNDGRRLGGFGGRGRGGNRNGPRNNNANAAAAGGAAGALISNNNFNNSFNQFNNNNNSNTNNNNSSNPAPEMGRRLERMVSAPLLQAQPKSCLRRKSCLHKSTADSIEVTDKNTDTDNVCTEQKSRNRKKVIFADDEGLSLTQVRVMSEPSNVPPYWSMKFLEQITQGLVTPHPADQWTVDFKQPASDYLAFRQSIESNYVSLENVIVKDEESIVVGTVKVKNISFEKEVIVRVTWDDWKSQQDIFCTYNKAYGPSTCAHVIFDTFSFKITLPPSSKRLEFCICFRADTQEYWDNNKGVNYTITKRSPFYYNALSPYDKNTSASLLNNNNSSSCQSQMRSALTEALNNTTNDSKNNWHHEPSPYW